MQDEKGNWRQVDRVERGQAIDAAGVPIGSVNELPDIGYQEKCKVILANGREFDGVIIAFNANSLHIHTPPAPNRLELPVKL